MAKDTLAENGIPLTPQGMNDNAPLEVEPNFYQTRGLHSIAELALQRCNGKSLLYKFPEPVLAIHGNLRTRIFIETTKTLYMLESFRDALISPTPPENTEIVLDDSGGTVFGDDDFPVTEVIL